MTVEKLCRFACCVTCLFFFCVPARTNAQAPVRAELHDPFKSVTAPELRLSALATDQPTNNGSGLTLFGNMGNNFLDSFRGDNLYLHLTAVAATALIVETGVDYEVHNYFNQHPEYGTWAHPVLSSGEYLPFVAGGTVARPAK
jgi:hypothetical protein